MRTMLSLSTLLVAVMLQAHEGQDHGAKDTKALIEHHQQMAQAHQKAASCLKSGKSVSECNMQAMKICPMMKPGKAGHCPFMGGSKGGKGHEGMDHHGQDGHQGHKEHGATETKEEQAKP